MTLRISLLRCLCQFLGVRARSSVYKRLNRPRSKHRKNKPKNRRCQLSPIVLDSICVAE